MMKRKNKSCFSIALVGISTALMLIGCAQNKPVNKPAPLPDVENAFEIKTQWKRSIQNGVKHYYSQLTPVVFSEYVISASRSGTVAAYNKETGKPAWKHDLSKNSAFVNKREPRLSGGVLAAYDRVFIGSENGTLFALNTKDGTLDWQQMIDGELISTPTSENGVIVVHTSAGAVQALDVISGKILWTVKDELPFLTLRSSSSPMISNDAVIYGKDDGKIGFILLATGQKIRDSIVKLPRGATDLQRISDVDATPVVQGNRFFGLSYNGTLIARELLSGNELWRKPYASYQNMALSGLDLYLTNTASHLVALNNEDGSEKWVNKELAYRETTAPVISGKYIIIGDKKGYLFWIDRNQGKIVAKRYLGGKGIYHAPIIDDQQLFVQTRNGKLYALQNP